MSTVQLLSAVEAVRRVSVGDVSARELAEQALTQAAGLDPAINAFTQLLPDRALAAADRVDDAIARGERLPLAGLPVTVKESLWLEGEPAEMACAALRGHVAPATATAVVRLESAGAVVFARTATSELCRGFATDTVAHGRTRNPLDLERGVGASSGGAAAALAAGVGFAALGSDETGSIRLPAAFCGLVGHRPTHGSVPITPGFPQGSGMNTVGPLARSAQDALLVLDAIAGGPRLSRYPVALAGSTVLVSADLGGRAPITAAARACFENALRALVHAGVSLLDVPRLPGVGDAVFEWICADVRAHYLVFERAGPRVQRLIELGAGVSAHRLAEIEALRAARAAAYASAFAATGAVAVLTPTLGFEALRHDERMVPELVGAEGDPWAFLYEASLTGLPAVTIPMGTGDHGLPLGLQLMGRHGDDDRLLRLAAAMEERITP